jgi:uncharacterized protein
VSRMRSSLKVLSFGASLAAAVAVVGATLATAPTVAAQEAVQPNISVSGQGFANVAPDVAELNVGVQTNGASAQQALNDNSAIMQHVIAAIQAQGVSAADIQTVGLSVYPNVPPPNPDGSQPVTSYQANNSVTVRVRDVSTVGAVLDAAFAAGANTSGGISFSLLDPSGPRQEALNAALADARAKAEVLAAGVGKQLGEVIAVYEDASFSPYPGPIAKAESQIQPGNISVGSSVRVTYELR